MYNEEYDCKHEVALATIGSKRILDAAVAFSTPSTPSDEVTTETEMMAAGRFRPNSTPPRSTPTVLTENRPRSCWMTSTEFRTPG
jgi:hypothetical protein